MSHVQHFLWILADALKYSAYIATIFYAPFAKTWFRALFVPFIFTFSWGIVRGISIFSFPEDSPPGLYFFLMSVQSILDAAIIRCIKLLLFKITTLKVFEEKLRLRFGSCHSNGKDH